MNSLLATVNVDTFLTEARLRISGSRVRRPVSGPYLRVNVAAHEERRPRSGGHLSHGSQRPGRPGLAGRVTRDRQSGTGAGRTTHA